MKTCTHPDCEQTNPQSFDNFCKDRYSKDGYKYYCKHCQNRENRLLRYFKKNIPLMTIDEKWCTIACLYIKGRDNSIICSYFNITTDDLIKILKYEHVFEHKICTKCNKLKSFDDFHKKTDTTLQNWCNDCISINNSNNEKLKEYRYNTNRQPVRFDTFAHQIGFADEIRRDPINLDILQTKCAYCGNWFIPNLIAITCRINALRSINSGEGRLYCSDKCKHECPIYQQQKSLKNNSHSREVQPQLRQLVFIRDNYTCQKCNTHQDLLETGLHCHHITGVEINPIESADVDNCITLCKNCHKEVHKLPGCKYVDLQKKVCKED